MKNIASIFIFFLICLHAFAGQAAELIGIEEVKLKEIKNGVQAEVHLTASVEYRYFTLEGPPRLALNLYDVGTSGKVIPEQKGIVQKIRIAQFQVKPEVIARVVLDLKRLPQSIEVHKEEKVIIISLLEQRTKGKEKEVAQKATSETLPKSPVIPQQETTQEISPTLISLNFRDADIKDVVMVLGQKAGLNILGTEELTGRITIYLEKVQAKEALDAILKNYNYGYREEGKNILQIVRIGAKEKIGVIERKDKQLMSKSFILKYAKADQVRGAVSSMVSLEGTVYADLPSNTLFVVESPVNIETIGKMIAELDLPPRQVMIEAKFAEISSARGESLQTMWRRIGKAGGQVSATASLAAAFAEGLFVTISTADLDVVIQMLEGTTDFNLISTPQVVTLDNQQANIVVVDKVPYKQAQISAEGVTSYQVVFLEVGVQLAVTPRITPDNNVIMDITPQVSDYIYSKEVPDIPVVTSRQLTTRVLVRDGQTLVIGGLLKDDVKKTTYRVPILGYIPLLGALFRYTSVDRVKLNLLIFITPRVIK